MKDNLLEFWTTAESMEGISISDDFQGIWLWKDRNDAEDNVSCAEGRKLYRVMVKVVEVTEVSDDE
jgi:hypothetical protein